MEEYQNKEEALKAIKFLNKIYSEVQESKELDSESKDNILERISDIGSLLREDYNI